jgi:hypothetical protein
MSDDEWPSPWEWVRPHRVIATNSGNSDYDIGVDTGGHVIIRFDDHVKGVVNDDLIHALEEGGAL